MMGGRLEWQAVPLLMELLGVDDAETFVEALCAMRDWGSRDG